MPDDIIACCLCGSELRYYHDDLIEGANGLAACAHHADESCLDHTDNVAATNCGECLTPLGIAKDRTQFSTGQVCPNCFPDEVDRSVPPNMVGAWRAAARYSAMCCGKIDEDLSPTDWTKPYVLYMTAHTLLETSVLMLWMAGRHPDEIIRKVMDDTRNGLENALGKLVVGDHLERMMLGWTQDGSLEENLRRVYESQGVDTGEGAPDGLN